VVRFFELYQDDDRTLTTSLFTASNFVVPIFTAIASVVYVDSIYNLTDNTPLRRKSIRYLNSRDPQATGTPQMWCPSGSGSGGYYIHPIPSTTAEQISVRERVYQYPTVLTGSAAPVIPAAWHAAIWMAAAAEGASLIEWPEKATEMEQRFMAFIAERRSPVEEAGAAGGRRYFTVGGPQYYG
jgi:hypothetical protein